MEDEEKRLRAQIAAEALADRVRGAEIRWARTYRRFVDPFVAQNQPERTKLGIFLEEAFPRGVWRAGWERIAARDQEDEAVEEARV